MHEPVLKKGFFVTFEGGEGVGKSTQIRLLYAFCVQNGYASVCTQEPGGTDFGRDIRSLFLNHHTLDNQEELLILLAARHHHIRHLIQPALDAGNIVLCDRYIDSTAVYQRQKEQTAGDHDRILSPDLIEWHNRAGITLWPDLTFVFCQNPETARIRKAQEDEVNRFDQASLSFYHAVQSRYQQLAKEEHQRCIVIDTDDKSVEEIALEIQSHLRAALPFPAHKEPMPI